LLGAGEALGDLARGEERNREDRKAGRRFGPATVSNQPYGLTAEALQPPQLNHVKRDDFLRFLTEHSDACLRAAEHLSQNYQSACDLVRSLGLSHTVSERLAKLILEWASEGRATDEGIRVTCSLTHEEIAQLLGISRETVTRELTVGCAAVTLLGHS
jgi:CRP/FNR family cyclic AMP-dependent transcriptional regulator